MARKVFFSFHYERDIWRASQIRNSWVTKPDQEAAGFVDAASWEEVKKKGDEAIRKWIRDQLEGTSVTIVLIGYETHDRKYVGYEIEQSCIRKNGLLGIYINGLKDQDDKTDPKGRNPFEKLTMKVDGQNKNLSEIYPCYDWIADKGYENLGKWIEKAAKDAGR